MTAKRRRPRQGEIGSTDGSSDHDKATRARLATGSLAAGAAALGGLLAVPATAATFNVANLADSGSGSLRQAITDANAAAGADVIAFQAGLTGTITLTSGQLEVFDDLGILGPGAAVLSVDGNGSSRVFFIRNNATEITVTISGLTITGGMASGYAGGIFSYGENLILEAVTVTANTGQYGGGIALVGTKGIDGLVGSLTLRDSLISGNTGIEAGGGGVYHRYAGDLVVENTRFTGNQAGHGGALSVSGALGDATITGSTFDGNTATVGGAVFFGYLGGDHVISATTFSRNEASLSGGGLAVGPFDQGGSMVITNVTISGNSAECIGGGLYAFGTDDDLSLTHTTVADNQVVGPCLDLTPRGRARLGVPTAGGGIAATLSTPPLDHVIVADNTAPTSPDVYQESNATWPVRYSLVEDPTGADFADNGGNIFSQDPQLSPLANYGGATETQRPGASSPAVDDGDPAFAPPPATDQRGLPRVSNGTIDMGAVERAPGAVGFALTAVNVDENGVTATLQATRTGGSDGPLSARVDTADVTATAPADYTAIVDGLVSWADLDSADKPISVSIQNDLLDEPDETFQVVLSPPPGLARGGNPTATVTIRDDDLPLVIAPTNIPTLGEWGRLLLAALLGGGGLAALRRRS